MTVIFHTIVDIPVRKQRRADPFGVGKPGAAFSVSKI
jgi:hypothetical protein